MKKPLVFVLFVSLGWFVACASQTPDSERRVAATQMMQEINIAPSSTLIITPSPTPRESATEAAISLPVWRISESPVSFGWLYDANVLLYSNRNSAEVWSYDVTAAQYEPFPDGFPWRPRKSMLTVLPPNARDVGSSPSGAKTLFTVPDVAATPTPPADGPGSLNQYRVQMWLSHDGGVRKLGTLENCINQYHWSADEQVVVISTHSYRGPCDVQVWLLDLQTDSLRPLYLKSEHDNSIGFIDITDDGKTILFSTGGFGMNKGQLFIRHLDNTVDTPVLSLWNVSVRGVWLHDEQSLLVKTTSLRPLRWRLFISDRSGVELKEIDLLIPDLFLSAWSLSPDRRWLAFLTEDYDDYEFNGLWIADLRLLQTYDPMD